MEGIASDYGGRCWTLDDIGLGRHDCSSLLWIHSLDDGRAEAMIDPRELLEDDSNGDI